MTRSSPITNREKGTTVCLGLRPTLVWNTPSALQHDAGQDAGAPRDALEKNEEGQPRLPGCRVDAGAYVGVTCNRSRAGIDQKPQQPQKTKQKRGLMQASESPSETCPLLRKNRTNSQSFQNRWTVNAYRYFRRVKCYGFFV
jgi:hypothetical protein